MKSGEYVYVESPTEIYKVTKNYGVTLDELKQHNPDKSFTGNEWIFIPKKIGILSFLRETYVIEDYSLLGTGRFAWPVPNYRKVSSHFGPRGRKHHDGIDIPAPRGTPVIAVDHGVVLYSSNGIRGYGNLIVISHGKDIYTVYGHNRKNKVSKGERVSKGQVIAEVGNTGRSTGPHLHFEIRVKNSVRNPIDYLTKNQASDSDSLL